MKANTRRVLLAWTLLFPAVFLRLFTTLYPTAWTFFYSLFNYNQIDRVKKFIGIGNFLKIFHDQAIIDSLVFTVIFTVSSVLLQVIFGFIVSMVMNSEFAGRKYLRIINLIPWAIAAPVAGYAAYWVFNSDYGLIDDLLFRTIGIKPLWLVNADLARIAVILVDVWKNAPFLALMILASLQGVDLQQYEAASIDGAGSVRRLWYITLPEISPTIITLSIFTAIWRITSFDLVYAMTQGGPGTKTSLLSYQVYIQAMMNMNFGYSSSIAILLLAVVGVFGIFGIYAQRKVSEM